MIFEAEEKVKMNELDQAMLDCEVIMESLAPSSMKDKLEMTQDILRRNSIIMMGNILTCTCFHCCDSLLSDDVI